jgi:hypothetical protein
MGIGLNRRRGGTSQFDPNVWSGRVARSFSVWRFAVFVIHRDRRVAFGHVDPRDVVAIIIIAEINSEPAMLAIVIAPETE